MKRKWGNESTLEIKEVIDEKHFLPQVLFWSTNDFLYVDSELKIENKRCKNVLIDSEGLTFSIW